MRPTPAPICARATLLRLSACVAVALAPHAAHLPPWAVALIVALLAWHALRTQRGWPLPPRTIRLALTLISLVGVYFTFGRINGQSAGATLLCVMLALKFTELRSRRDCLVALLLAYFVLATECLFSQSILMVGYLAVGAWLITASLVEVSHAPGPLAPTLSLRTAAALLLQSVPLMLLLFVLFPRLPGPLWALPSGASAHTGLSDRMTPGGLAHLARDGSVAFRVQFDGPVPPPDERYWRGPVLWTFDGSTWRPGPPTRNTTVRPQNLQPQGSAIDYTVTLEADDARWLLALDIPAGGPEDAVFTPADSMRAIEPIRERRRYRARSYTRYRLHPSALPAARKRLALSLPPGKDPRTRALVRHWLAQGNHGRRLVQRALRYFHQQDFVYTLEPPPLSGPNSVDEFVFGTRKGFCEHFASAFTFMMRAGGVPARVVTGYQGGEFNTVGGYLIVRQSDAHAWSEVWLPGRGWVRVDPTAAVDPARVHLGLGGALPSDPDLPSLARLGGGWIKAIDLHWDWVNMLWNRAVLAYGPALQTNLLSRIGLGSWQRMALALTALGGAFLAALGVALLWSAHKGAAVSPTERAWHTACTRLARRGLTRHSGEGPRDFASRVGAAHPRWRAQFDEISTLYVRARYADDAGAEARLRRAVRQFKPR